ncbi:MAG: hypothetical protein PUG48_03765 [Clostridia bacterium]|nr:hypothetical protein [Clostridia bacterium]
MAIVMRKQSGKCTAIIDDSCVTNKKDEIDTILDNIYNIYLHSEYSVSKEPPENKKTNHKK